MDATCKLKLTSEREGARRLTTEELLVELTAIAHPLRLRIIAELTHGRVYVSERARRRSAGTTATISTWKRTADERSM